MINNNIKQLREIISLSNNNLNISLANNKDDLIIILAEQKRDIIKRFKNANYKTWWREINHGKDLDGSFITESLYIENKG